MFIFGLIGIVALALGILHFTSTDTICKIDEIGKKVIITMDKMVKKYPKRLGVLYIIAATFLIYVGFFLK
ncbi:MAG: hypothetical protein V2A72_01250 [Candidatus Omnitrophota bacterium]